MALEIPKNDKLSPEEAAVEARFSAEVRSDTDAFVRRYHENFCRDGIWIDTDRARELCSAYSESEAARTRWSRAVYNPAKALADEVYRRALLRPGSAGRKILFTSGGTGVGKSTALAQLMPGGSLAASEFYLLVDGTLSDMEAAREKIRLALGRGYRVRIIHVHRAFPETLRMVVRRALDIGRVVTLDNIATTHFRSRQTFFGLVEEFSRYGERFTVGVRVNSLAGDDPDVPLARFAGMPGGTVEEMRAAAHALFRAESGGLESSHPAIYEAFLQAGSRQ